MSMVSARKPIASRPLPAAAAVRETALSGAGLLAARCVSLGLLALALGAPSAEAARFGGSSSSSRSFGARSTPTPNYSPPPSAAPAPAPAPRSTAPAPTRSFQRPTPSASPPWYMTPTGVILAGSAAALLLSNDTPAATAATAASAPTPSNAEKSAIAHLEDDIRRLKADIGNGEIGPNLINVGLLDTAFAEIGALPDGAEKDSRALQLASDIKAVRAHTATIKPDAKRPIASPTVPLASTTVANSASSPASTTAAPAASAPQVATVGPESRPIFAALENNISQLKSDINCGLIPSGIVDLTRLQTMFTTVSNLPEGDDKNRRAIQLSRDIQTLRAYIAETSANASPPAPPAEMTATPERRSIFNGYTAFIALATLGAVFAARAGQVEPREDGHF